MPHFTLKVVTYDGGGSRFGANAETQDKPSDKHMPPSIGKGLPEASESRDQTRDEDSAPASKGLVHGICQPTTNEGAAKVWCRVHKPEQPRVALVSGIAYAKLHFIECLSAVDDCLIHSLHGRTE